MARVVEATIVDPSNAKRIDSPENGDYHERPSESTTLPAENAQFRCSSLERTLLRRLVSSSTLQSLKLVLGNSCEFTVGPEPIAHTLAIRSRSALRRMLFNPTMGFLDGYVSGDVEVDGDLIDFLTPLQKRFSLTAEPSVTIGRALRSFFRRRHALHAQKNVTHHYDVGNDFYRLWLDEQLLYTCAYFEREDVTLEQAQRAKIDYVCRKLRLKEGESVIEAGCGWGALALHMAERYGVRVRAFNLSDEQLEFARTRAREMNLANRVEFVKGDWREIRGNCDAFVSIGMLEHVGPENFKKLGLVISQALGKQGRGLIHTIGQNTPEPVCRWIEQRVFPGAQPPTLKQMMNIFSPHNLAVLDVENLRPHYSLTLRHWLQRFEKQQDRIREMFDDEFVRLWRMYLAASASAFEAGSLQLYQVLFAPISSSFFPMTRIAPHSENGSGS